MNVKTNIIISQGIYFFMKMTITLVIVFSLVFSGCAIVRDNDMDGVKMTETDLNNDSSLEVATFAGGCFWCMESPYEKMEGVAEVISGYSGGEKKNPTYSQVSSGSTKHREAVQVYYDPSKTSYEDLLDLFWRQIDPTDSGGQFADRGFQYTTAIFYHNNSQKELAEKSRDDYQKYFSENIVTPIEEFKNFYPAEDYHQDYHTKNPIRYNAYKKGSGRTDFLKEQWDE